MVQINTQESQSLAGRFGVRSIPAIMLLRDGKVVDQIAGAQTVEAVVGWFHKSR